LIAKSGLTPRDVQWVPLGSDVSGRASALASNRVDATMLTAPVYFKLEQEGYRNLGNISDYDDIYAPSVYLMSKAMIRANPKLPELIIKAHAEAIKRFYDDKPFAMKAYIAFDKQPEADVSRIYDLYKKGNIFERVPYVMAGAVKATLSQQVDQRIAADFKEFDFHKIVDNGVIDKLVKEGFFQQLFGPGMKAEEQSKAKLAFR
jgi:ABC-type nitrate/sulfonate/bicarbonate transport system substrate-binding protein